MNNTLYVAFHGEGSTDERFFVNISERIIKRFLLKNNISAEISWLILREKKATSALTLISAAKTSKDQDLLIFHRDADNPDWVICYNLHFQEGLENIMELPGKTVCKKVIAAIPVKETEAWILCNKELLKDIIESDLSLTSLELTYHTKNIENIGDPKFVIDNAINLHKLSLPARRRKFAINRSEIYERFSQEIEFEHLEKLDSFIHFRDGLENALAILFPSVKI